MKMRSRAATTLVIASRRFGLLIGVAVGITGLIAFAPAPAVAAGTENEAPQGLVRVATNPPSPEPMMPQQTTGSHLFPIRQTLYEALVGFDPETGDRNVPMLAESWSHSDDYRVWTFKLRKGVQFHRDAGELTSEDVKFSVDLITRPDSLSTDAALFRAVVSSVETPERHTVVFKLTKPMDFAAKVVIWDTSLLIASKAYFDKVGEKEYSAHPVGTGPYQLDSALPGQEMRFSYFDGYWGKAPEFKQLDLKFVADEQTRVNMLLAGEIDVADIPRVQIDTVKSAGMDVDAGAVPAVTPMIWFGSLYLPDSGGMPWNDVRVREALNIGFDRSVLAKSIFRGYAIPVAFGTLGPTTPGYHELNRQPYAYDPKKAKTLLAQAGYPNGFELAIKVVNQAGISELSTVVEAISAQWSALGVTARLEPSEQAPLAQGYRARKPMPFLFTTRSAYSPFDAASLFDVFYTKKGGFGGMTDEISTAVDAANAEPDAEKKKQLNAKVGQLVYDGFWNIPMPAVIPTVARNPKVVSSWNGTFGYQFDGLTTLGRAK